MAVAGSRKAAFVIGPAPQQNIALAATQAVIVAHVIGGKPGEASGWQGQIMALKAGTLSAMWRYRPKAR